MEKRCDNCRFWQQIFNLTSRGYCRRYPPQQVSEVHSEGRHDARFPYTDGDQWCGEHKNG